MRIEIKTHRCIALCQRLNDFILIRCIEQKPFRIDGLYNCIFRKLHQNKSMDSIKSQSKSIATKNKTNLSIKCQKVTFTNSLVQFPQIFNVCLINRELIVDISQKGAVFSIFVLFKWIMPISCLDQIILHPTRICEKSAITATVSFNVVFTILPGVSCMIQQHAEFFTCFWADWWTIRQAKNAWNIRFVWMTLWHKNKRIYFSIKWYCVWS